MNATKPNEIVNVSIDADRVYDVVLIGAGISSANAAYILRQRDENLSMLVLEAKDRVGGRTLTIDIPSSRPGQTAKWDIGAQWVTDSQKNVTKLMRELNIETFKQFTTGNKVLESNGKRTVFNSAYPYDSWYSWLDMRLYMKRVDKDVKRLNTIHPYADAELAERLESQTFKDYLFSKAYTSTVRGVIRSNMSTVFGFELDQGILICSIQLSVGIQYRTVTVRLT
jgi:monoamine oxidase